MLTMLFNTNWIYDVILGIGIILCIIACIKSPQAKYFIATIVAVVMVTLTGYSTIQLNYYYRASGGIRGAIEDIISPNEVDTNLVSEIQFNFKNVMLTETGNQNQYSATFIDSQNLKLSPKNVYTILVNDTPCTSVDSDVDYVIAKYSYNFYDENKSLIINDTLTFNFSFFTSQCELKVTTNGGARALDYWNNYFNRNTFIVTILNSGIERNTDELFSQYKTITYKVNNSIFATRLLIVGSEIPNIEIDDSNFDCWTINGNAVNYNVDKVTNDVTLVARFN